MSMNGFARFVVKDAAAASRGTIVPLLSATSLPSSRRALGTLLRRLAADLEVAATTVVIFKSAPLVLVFLNL